MSGLLSGEKADLFRAAITANGIKTTATATISSEVEISNDSGNPIPVRAAGAATIANSSVASSASSVTVLASNANRRGATIFNDSTQVLYLSLAGGTASTTNYSVQIPAGGYYEVPFNITTILTGIWASANGNARVTEVAA